MLPICVSCSSFLVYIPRLLFLFGILVSCWLSNRTSTFYFVFLYSNYRKALQEKSRPNSDSVLFKIYVIVLAIYAGVQFFLSLLMQIPACHRLTNGCDNWPLIRFIKWMNQVDINLSLLFFAIKKQVLSWSPPTPPPPHPYAMPIMYHYVQACAFYYIWYYKFCTFCALLFNRIGLHIIPSLLTFWSHVHV